MKKWYHEIKEKTNRKYHQGYYPKHFRTPNLIVCFLYETGYFFGDFVPLLLNLIEGIYSTIKKLVGFVVGLLVDSMIFIVLAGSIVFSVAHSIERLRQSGANGGLEYVGVLMFEVIFMSSSAMLTGLLMKKKVPKSFLEWFGLILTCLGFLVGLGFVWWSNVNGMAPTTEGLIIGSAVPLLVLIGQGIIAYRYFIENASEEESHVNKTESKELMKQNRSLNNQPNGEQTESEQTESKMAEKIEQNSPEQLITEQKQTEQEKEQNLSKQSNTEHIESEQNEQEKIEQNLSEQTASDQTKNEQNEQEKSEQTERESGEENKEENNLESNKETMENERGEQGKIEQENNESSNSEQNENEQKEQPVIEQKSVEQSNIEQVDRTEKNEQYEIQKSNKKTNKRSNAHLRVVRTNKVKKGKSEQVAQYVLRLMKQNKEFTVRQVAEKIGCSPSTAQKGINKAKMMKQEA